MLSVFFITNTSLKSQIVKFHFPINGMTGVVLNPNIMVRTSGKIDSSSVSFIDNTSMVTRTPFLDSNIARDNLKPTIMVIPKVIVDSLPDSLYKYLQVFGSSQIVNDSNIVWNSTMNLIPNTEYKLFVNNLKIVKYYAVADYYDTLLVNDTSISFTTMKEIDKIIYFPYNHFNNSICKDTFSVYFNNKLTSHQVSSQNIFRMEKLDSTIYVGDTVYTEYYSPVSYTTWLSNSDSSLIKLHITDTLQTNQQYKLIVKSSLLNGDTLTDVSHKMSFSDNFITKKNIFLTNNDTTTNTTDFISPSDEYLITQLGESQELRYADSIPNYVFSHWEIITNGDTTYSINKSLFLTSSCDTLKNYTINAYFNPQDSITITLIDSNNITCKIYNSNNVLLGGAGTYIVAPNSNVYVTAHSASTGFAFREWVINTDDVEIATAGLPTGNWIMELPNRGRDINIHPVDEPYSPIGSFCLRTSAGFDACEIEPSGVYTITPSTLDRTGIGPFIEKVKFKINDGFKNCYEVYGYAVSSGNNTGGFNLITPPSDEIEIEVMLAKCTNVKFYYRAKKAYTLIVEAELLKRSGMPGEIGKEKDVTVQVRFLKGCVGNKKYVNDGSEFSKIHYVENFLINSKNPLEIKDIPCEYIAELTVIWDIREEGFEFIQWSNAPSYTVLTSPNTKIKNSRKFEVTMNSNIKVRAIFRENFRLRKIGVYRSDNVSSVEWITTKRWKEIQALNGMVEDIEIRRFYNGNTDDGYETKISLLFNESVNKTSVENNNIVLNDFSERVDNALSDPEYNYIGNSTNLSYSNSDKQIAFQVNNTNRNNFNTIPKGEIFDLRVGLNGTAGVKIKNTLNFDLFNPNAFKGETELPGVLWTYTDIYVDHKVDDLGYICEFTTHHSTSIVEMVTSQNTVTINPIELIADFIPDSKKDLDCNVWYPKSGDNFPNNQIIINKSELNNNNGISTVLKFVDLDYISYYDLKSSFQSAFLFGLDQVFEFNLDDVSRFIFNFFITVKKIHYLGIKILFNIIASVLNTFNSLVYDDIGQIIYFFDWKDKWFGAHPSINKSFEDGYVKGKTQIKLRKTAANNSTY